MAELIKTNGEVITVSPKGKTFKLKELYELIGCDLIEIVHIANGRLLVVDEEGKLKDNIEINKRASMLAGCIIVGNAVVCDDKEFD